MMTPERELGLSGRLAQSRQERILRQDGRFNVVRVGQGFWQSINPYHMLIEIPWPYFFGFVFSVYATLNLVFAGLYWLCGPEAIAGADGRFLQLYFFSVQTIATIGYGTMTPVTVWANLLVSIEALVGLLGFALATGILFARFSRPSATILFSNVALIAPFQGGSALMFRVVNGRSNQLMEVRAQVTYSRMVQGVRTFQALTLERAEIMFLASQWVVVHPITDESPLYGKSAADIVADDPEIFILMSAIDETFSQTVHRRFSYADSDIVHGAKFGDLYGSTKDDLLTVDISRLSEYEPVALPRLEQSHRGQLT